jgi:hypothetical protein
MKQWSLPNREDKFFTHFATYNLCERGVYYYYYHHHHHHYYYYYYYYYVQHVFFSQV